MLDVAPEILVPSRSHWYEVMVPLEVAALAVRVMADPLHTWLVPSILTVGNGLTVMVMVAVPV